MLPYSQHWRGMIVTEPPADLDAVLTLVEAIKPHFEGKPAQVQGAALAEMLSLWLAGHVNQNNPDKSDRVRKAVLEEHLKTVWQLVPINYEMVIKPRLQGRPRGPH